MQLLILLFFSLSTFASENLKQECGKQDMPACEKLAVYFLDQESWDKALMIGEALCKREIPRGCMAAGSASLMLGKLKEGKDYLTQACDAFEPFSCRSLSRMMDKIGEKTLSEMYQRRACFYGLSESCEGLSSKNWYSPAGLGLIENIRTDCRGANDETCASHLRAVKACALPLNKQDCQLLAGYLSIYFHAKYLQTEAKLLLMTVYTQQKSLRTGTQKKYTYDFKEVMKGVTPLEKSNYIVGFMKACSKKYVKGRKTISNMRELHPPTFRLQSPRITANILSYFSKGRAEECYDSKVGYEAYAVTSLDPLNPTRLDVWKIDQDQRIEHLVDGLPLP